MKRVIDDTYKEAKRRRILLGLMALLGLNFLHLLSPTSEIEILAATLKPELA